ncbi:MAG: ParA family protein [Blautia sp.]|nr:ParA family protein [Blautia sp.]
MKKTITICFTNNKGGSGKSTTCGNIGAAMARKGLKVLMIDGDMQMNLSLSFFPEDKVLEMSDSRNNLYDAVIGQKDLKSYIVRTPYENLDMIPSSARMSSAEAELSRGRKKESVLSTCLSGIKESKEYDFILIDAPPTLGNWVMNILCASDYVLVPVEASPWGMFGLANMFDFLNEAKEISPSLDILGIVVTKADLRKGYFKQTLETLREMEGVYLFDSYIRVDSAVEWAQDNSAPVVEYKRSCRSAKEYIKLAEEVTERAGR